MNIWLELNSILLVIMMFKIWFSNYWISWLWFPEILDMFFITKYRKFHGILLGIIFFPAMITHFIALTLLCICYIMYSHIKEFIKEIKK